MGELREKMIRDIKTRGLSESSVQSYVASMERLIKHYEKSPELIELAEIQKFQLHLVEVRKLSAQTVNLYMAGVRFFYSHTLNRHWPLGSIPRMKVKRPLPLLLSLGQVADLLSAVKHPKYRALLMTVYGAGLRVSEATHLAARDILSARMQIHVRHGKGGKARYTVLAEALLLELRGYWKASRGESKDHFLFPGQDPQKPVSTASVRKVLREAKERIGLHGRIQVHSLRHCFATHLLESGVDIRIIQILLGHSTISSTMIYTHLRDQRGLGVKSPLDAIAEKLIQSSDTQ